MSEPIRNMTLSFPCREEWENFEVVPGGRLCQHCKYIVRDFRDCSMGELRELLQSGQHVCGRFRIEQLSASFIKAAAAVMVIGAGESCQSEEPVPLVQQVPQKEEFVKVEGDVMVTGVVIIVDDFPPAEEGGDSIKTEKKIKEE